MHPTDRYSEPYNATGGLAGEGVINQLGRPDIEAFEMLVRESVQNSWDARRQNSPGIEVEIGCTTLDDESAQDLRDFVLPNPPPGLPLSHELVGDVRLLYFADYGTDGLSGPTRADQVEDGSSYDFVDFVRNIGSPPDKEFGGGSFGYGKAAFYIASRARTILIDTLCVGGDGELERRFIASALGNTFTERGRPHTGRHWWGRVEDGVPEPLTGRDAAQAAALIGLPDRSTPEDLGTTIAVVAPDFVDELPPGHTPMGFISECLVWNFWPRMLDTRGSVNPTMKFQVSEEGRKVPVADPRTHERLRDFTEAMDALRSEPSRDESDPFITDRAITCLRPIQELGRLVLVKGPASQVSLDDNAPAPQGKRATAKSVHHVVLMRSAELVVRYLPGPEPTTATMGYSGVFQCHRPLDTVFRQAEPPTHDDWVFRSVTGKTDRKFVKVALDRIRTICREAAGHGGASPAPSEGSAVPLGEFAESLADLMGGSDGPGSRRSAARRAQNPTAGGKRKRKANPSPESSDSEAAWIDSEPTDTSPTTVRDPSQSERRSRPPQTRLGGSPKPIIGPDGNGLLAYPFKLKTNGNALRLRARVEVMTNDGDAAEGEPPLGVAVPEVQSWVRPDGLRVKGSAVEVDAEWGDGDWVAEVALVDEAVTRLDIEAALA